MIRMMFVTTTPVFECDLFGGAVVPLPNEAVWLNGRRYTVLSRTWQFKAGEPVEVAITVTETG